MSNWTVLVEEKKDGGVESHGGGGEGAVTCLCKKSIRGDI